MLPIGYVVNGTYRVEGILGQGGMSVVYAVAHTRLRRRFALKLIHAAYADHQFMLQRFLREAHILAELRHPHIVDVVDSDSTPEGTPYLVMELLQGEMLNRFMARTGALPPPLALSICRQIGQALHVAHRAGVIHRDLTPANIFLCRHDDNPHFIKVLDFGIAKWANPQAPLRTIGPMLMGTPPYMSPEQAAARMEEIDERTDQFALAAILYEMLSGRRAFMQEGDSNEVILERVQRDQPPPLPLPEINDAVFRALSKDRDQRFSSIAEFLVAAGVPLSLVDEHVVPAPQTDSGLSRTLPATTQAAPSPEITPATEPPIPSTAALPSPARPAEPETSAALEDASGSPHVHSSSLMEAKSEPAAMVRPEAEPKLDPDPSGPVAAAGKKNGDLDLPTALPDRPSGTRVGPWWVLAVVMAAVVVWQFLPIRSGSQSVPDLSKSRSPDLRPEGDLRIDLSPDLATLSVPDLGTTDASSADAAPPIQVTMSRPAPCRPMLRIGPEQLSKPQRDAVTACLRWRSVAAKLPSFFEVTLKRNSRGTLLPDSGPGAFYDGTFLACLEKKFSQTPAPGMVRVSRTCVK